MFDRMKRLVLRSACLLAAAGFALQPAAASTIPPTCSELLVPPQACDAEAQQCAGACPGNKANSWSRQWQPYWDLCLGMKQKQNPGFSKTQFMCGPNGDKLEVVYYKPADRWICCLRNSPAGGNDSAPVVVPRTVSPEKR